MTGVQGGKFLIDVSVVLQFLDLKAGYRVGDFGCGSSGFFAIPVAKAVGEGGKVHAIDVQQSALDSLKSLVIEEGLRNVDMVWSDLEVYGATKIEPNSLDRGFLINVLFQTSKPDAILKEAARLLKHGGLLMVVEWNKDTSQLGPPLNMRIPKEILMEKLNLLNLVKKAEFEPGPYHYGLVFEKIV